jgi:hypothetical protein
LPHRPPPEIANIWTLSADTYDFGVKKPWKMLKVPWGSVYEQVRSVLGSKPLIP